MEHAGCRKTFSAREEASRACGESKEREVSGSCFAWATGVHEALGPCSQINCKREGTLAPGPWKRIGGHGLIAEFPGVRVADLLDVGWHVEPVRCVPEKGKRGRSHFAAAGWALALGSNE